MHFSLTPLTWSPLMSRPLQIEFPGVFDHLTSRGDRREPIYVDDGDRHALLAVLAETMNRFNAALLAYCLMGVRDAERAAHEARSSRGNAPEPVRNRAPPQRWGRLASLTELP